MIKVKDMKRSALTHFSGLLFLAAVLVFTAPALAQVKQVSRGGVTKTEQMLKEISATYQPFQGKDSFLVSYQGKQMKQIDLIVVEAAEGIAVLVDVAAGKEVELSPALMRKLLEYNMSVDFIKVGISDIGSVRIGSEVFLPSITPAGFEKVLDQAAAGADEIAGLIAPFRKTVRTEK